MPYFRTTDYIDRIIDHVARNPERAQDAKAELRSLADRGFRSLPRSKEQITDADRYEDMFDNMPV